MKTTSKNSNKKRESLIFGKLMLIKGYVKRFVWLIVKTILTNLFTKKLKTQNPS